MTSFNDTVVAITAICAATLALMGIVVAYASLRASEKTRHSGDSRDKSAPQVHTKDDEQHSELERFDSQKASPAEERPAQVHDSWADIRKKVAFLKNPDDTFDFRDK